MLTLLYLFVASGHDAAVLLGRVALVVGFQVLLVAIALLSIAAGGAAGRGGDEPGSDDDGGTDRRRPEPPRPPPEPHVSWPDFERQFAEHVRTRDKVPVG